MAPVDSSALLREARGRAGLTLRALASRAETSHSTLAAYESGSKTPNVATLERILSAAGFAADVSLHRRHRGNSDMTKAEELEAVLILAAAFPARHSRQLDRAVFPYTGAGR